MTLELHVATGARAGHRARFDGDRVVVGRDPAADLRLDAVADRDASAQHCELLRAADGWRVRDLGSTNGTFVNGTRVRGEVPVRDGDRISCGANGPTIVARVAHANASSVADATGVARTPSDARRRSSPARAAIAAVIVALAAGVAGTAFVQRRADARVAAAESLRRDADSARVAAARDVRALQGRLASSDSARQAAAALPAVASPVRSAGSPGTADGVGDAGAVARRALRAVALVAVEAANGVASSGTAFGVSADGLLVTNRHVVLGADGSPPSRVAVKYADSDEWLEARLVRPHATADLAIVRVVAAGRYPALAPLAAGEAPVGSEIFVVGFPAAAETPGERAFEAGVARPALFGGRVSKVADGVLVIDAYAGRGSSGSPVLDARGAVVGVVYGGAREAGGRVAYAATGAALRGLLR